MDRAPKKLRMLPPIRYTEEYEGIVKLAAMREGRTVTDFQRHAVTTYMLQFHAGMVDVNDGEVTDFGALQCDASQAGEALT